MAALRFTTTRLSDLRAAGRLQELQHATLAPFLERELGADYGRLFADFEAETSDVRAWYVDAGVPPRSIATLPEGEAESLRQRVADMIGLIGDLAARIAGESTQKANLARILVAATTFPIEDIWTDGAQPIIVNWGFHRHDVEAGVPRAIRDRIRRPQDRMPDARAAPAAAPAVAVALSAGVAPIPKPAWRRWFVLPAILWLAFLMLVAASYDRLLPACGIVGPLGLAQLDACPLSPAAAAIFIEGAELQALVDTAELEATRRRGQCPAPGRAGLRTLGGTTVVDRSL